MFDRNLDLATIAIPTFNRAGLLARSVASALAQDYPALEILIVDNASEDATESVAQALANADPRVRYIRQTENVGPVPNFETGLKHAKGRYFMWLADDDWITADYLRRCIETLEGGGHAIAVGRDYSHIGPIVETEPIVDSLAVDPRARALHYLRHVGSNAAVYGVYRTAEARSCLPFPKNVGGDVLWVLRMLRQGTLAVVADVGLHRNAGGLSWNFREMASQLGGGRFSRGLPRIFIGYDLLKTLTFNGDYRFADQARRQAVFAIQATLIVWIQHQAIGELATPIRTRLQVAIPKPIYDTLRRWYYPWRIVCASIRKIIVRR